MYAPGLFLYDPVCTFCLHLASVLTWTTFSLVYLELYMQMGFLQNTFNIGIITYAFFFF